ncbi:hypothetical protein Lser_V15G25524 [Lactuca serriola]
MLMSPSSPFPPPAPSASPPTRRGYLCEVWHHLTAKIDDPKAAKRTDAILIAASVIAAMNFQAVISPPRGIYQETRYNLKHQIYKAGEAIGAHLDPQGYKNFYLANTISFTSSMSAIFLLLCSVSLQRRIFTILTTATMFVAITATTYSYALALESITPSQERSWLFVQKIVTMALVGWLVVATSIFVGFLWTQYEGAPTHKWLVKHVPALRDFIIHA